MSLTSSLIQLIRDKPISDYDLASAAMFTLDAVACAYAGSNTPTGEKIIAWAKHGDLDSRSQGFLMGALTHITETDDLHRASVTHPGCVVVPAALCLGEQTGASAEKILRAIVHGFEAMCRIGAAVGPTHYKVWHNTATCGPYGSAMAAATLLDLDLEATVNALGNAGTQSSGFWQFIETGAMSKHLHAGRACESGLLAAELAAWGFTGPPEILEGEKGMFAGMCIDPIPEAILAAPDDAWQLPLTSIKPWPCCRHTHPAIDCALELSRQLNGSEIQSVEVDTYQAALDVCDRPDPENEYQAKFSLYHCVAIALQDGQVKLDSFTEQARTQTADLRHATRLQVVDPFDSRYPLSWGSGVRLTTSSGKTLAVERKDCKGDPELALDESEMRVKAMNLMQFGGLIESEAAARCDLILSLPGNNETPKLFSEFIDSIGVNKQV
ncbi:MAG: MmgE/PrpD family protein [Gammaproteobacteria bacterium]|nr:MmgE/PrpD family protein [Gammaproteobacteria bacterium]